MKDTIIPVVSILCSTFASIFVAVYTAYNERKKSYSEFKVDNKYKQAEFFAELLAALDAYFIACDNENKTILVKAIARFMPYAPNEFHDDLINLIFSLDQQAKYSVLEYKKKLFCKYSEYIQSTTKNPQKIKR